VTCKDRKNLLDAKQQSNKETVLKDIFLCVLAASLLCDKKIF